MKPMTFRIALSFILGAVLCTAADARPWKSLYVFGDSYSDSGAGYVDCNGPTAVVYLARALGIPFTNAADPHPDNQSLNFAVSGAQTGGGNGRHVMHALLDRGMKTQVADFVGRVHAGKVHFDPETTLFFLAGGLNDKRLPSATTKANLEGEIRALYDVGGRYFLVALLPTKIPSFSAVGRRLDPVIATIPGDLNGKLAGAHVAISHWGEYYDEVMEHAAKYGFTNTTEACAGRRIFKQDPTPRGDPNTFYFYHSGHPSTAVHRIVGEQLAKEAATVFP